MNTRNSNHDRSLQLEWMLDKHLRSAREPDESHQPCYGDVTELNSCRLILDSVGRKTLQKIAEDAIDLLETSVAIYEINGDYAFGMFSSGWCRLMDSASRKLCNTDDNRTALDCGRWLCHENCWNDSARTAIESGHSTDIQCVGGINLYAEPIYAGEDVIGVINVGYGTPPGDSGRLKELAEAFNIDPEQLKKHADAYEQRPRFLIDLAKKRLKTSASLIGEMVEKSMLQKELQKNKEFLETTGRMARIGGWEVDAETSDIRWTRETYHIHEVPMDYKPTFDKMIEFFHPQDRPELLRAFQRALGEGHPYDMEVRFITAEGNHLWTRTQCEPEIVQGKTIRLKGTFQDITGRKKAEERYKNLFNSTNDGICLHELIYEDSKPVDYRILDINPKYEELTGIRRDQAIGALASHLYSSDNAPYLEIYSKVVATEKPTSFEAYFSPMEKHFLISVFSPSKNQFATVFQDITNQKKMEEQLRHAHKMEAIGTLAGGIAHEFNNMLGIIIGNTELALDDVPEWNPAADCIQEIRTASLRAKDVVQKLLSVARKTPESRKPIQIRSVVNESLELLRKTIPASIEIRPNLTSTTEMILADPTEISQVLINLCTNSVHAMVGGKGILEVTLENRTFNTRSSDRFGNIDPGEYVKLTVSDNGTGIPPDTLDRIFEPYFTTKDIDEGLGLGLAVVHGIVKKHEGAISIESEVGTGTTVEVLFPVIDENRAM